MFFFFKQKTAYEMRISDWSSDVCSSDLRARELTRGIGRAMFEHRAVAQVDVPVVGAADSQAVGHRKDPSIGGLALAAGSLDYRHGQYHPSRPRARPPDGRRCPRLPPGSRHPRHVRKPDWVIGREAWRERVD